MQLLSLTNNLVNPRQANPPRIWPLLVILSFWGVLFLLLLGLNMRRGLNHDEHQFVASGKLVAQGLLPYVDFPYFHAPTLALLYGLLFERFPALLLAARQLSIFCAWLSTVVLFLVAYWRARSHAWLLRLLYAVGVALLWVGSPLFVYTSGRAWNHDLPLLLALLASLLLPIPLGDRLKRNHQETKTQRFLATQLGLLPFVESLALPLGSSLRLGASGVLVGLAASTRLSFAFLLPALVVALGLWLGKRGWRRWLLAATLLGLGVLIGFAPAIYCWWQAPESFFFGNVEYVRLNTLYYREQSPPPTTMSLGGKLLFLLQVFGLQPGNLLIILVLVGAFWPVFGWPCAPFVVLRSPKFSFAFLVALVAAGFLLIGALSATPSQTQYFFAPLPFFLLAGIEGLTLWPKERQRRAMQVVAGLGGVALVLALPSYAPGLAQLFTPDKWYPWTLHRRASELATLVDHGKVLTLAPIYPLESNLEVYHSMATGSFAWRVAHLVEPERRARLGLPLGDDPALLWQMEPPRAVLVGGELDDAEEEGALVAAAQAHGYVPVPANDDYTLWLSPLVEWGKSIRLGGYSLPAEPVSAGAVVQATFYLQSSQPIMGDLNVLVRLVDQRGDELLRSEGWPWGSATSTWAPGDVWPDGHRLTLPKQTAPGFYRVEMGFYDPATLENLGETATLDYLRVGPGATPISEPNTLALFGGQIALRSAEMNLTSIAAGGSLTAKLVWQAQARVTTDYTLFAHLVGVDQQPMAQQDQPPTAGFMPTRFWRAGDVVDDVVSMTLPATLLPGEYMLLIGLYDPQSLQRLPVTHNGQPAGDAVRIGVVAVR
jgi:hypothetical protein